MEPIIEMKGIRKEFPPVVALSDINFRLYPGEVHALIGENGAGKSTLMKILSGVYAPSEGMITVEGKDYAQLSPQLSQELGISIIFQELSLIPTLSVAENMFVGKLPHNKVLGFSLTSQRKIVEAALNVMKEVGLNIDPSTVVSELSISEKQRVEIAKAVAANARVLIMDEPTSSLSKEETDQLFSTIRTLKKNGVAIVFISHKLSELREIGDRITILKDGRSVGTCLINEIESENDIIVKMVGREIANTRYNTDSKISDHVIFSVKNLSRRDQKISAISFDLHEGEILGFSGLVGAGRTELMEAIFGHYPDTKGEILLKGKKITNRSPYATIKQKIGMITESRRETGFLKNFTINKNISVPLTQQKAKMGGIGGLIRRTEDRRHAADYVEKMKIRCASIDQPIINLSGGNQQKVIIAKWLNADSELLIFDEPTKGIDVGSKNEIYQIMRDLANRGKGILMVSSELPELLSVCDRIAIISAGRMVAIVNQDQFKEEIIMRYATKGAQDE